MEALKLLQNNIIDLIAVKKCLSCNNINQQANYLCSSCFDQLRYIKVQEENSFSIFLWTDFSKTLIHKFKFEKRLNYGKFIANFMVNFIDKNLQYFDIDIIIFVPISKRRIFVRGFNQAAFLAKIIAKKIKKPILYNILKRKHSKHQSHLTATQRKVNLIGKISLNRKKEIFLKGKNILLIDDVKATGTTLKYCQKELKKSTSQKNNKFYFCKNYSIVSCARVLLSFFK